MDESKEENDEGYLDDEGWSEGGGREESEEGQGFDNLQQWVGEEQSTWGLREVGDGIERRISLIGILQSPPRRTFMGFDLIFIN